MLGYILGSLGALGISHPYLLLFLVQMLSWSVETPLVSSLLLTSLHQPQQSLLLRGPVPRTLTWEDELLLVFVVVGSLQKTENTSVSATRVLSRWAPSLIPTVTAQSSSVHPQRVHASADTPNYKGVGTCETQPLDISHSLKPGQVLSEAQ